MSTPGTGIGSGPAGCDDRQHDGRDHSHAAGHGHGWRHDDDRGPGSRCGGANAGAPDAALRDPVRGMTVTPQSRHLATHEGRTYFSCSGACRS